MKRLTAIVLALILALSCVSVSAFADTKTDTSDMIGYYRDGCNLSVPGLPKYIKGTFDYDERYAAILTEHPDYNGIGMRFSDSFYNVSFKTEGTVTTYEYTLKDGVTIDDYYDSVDERNAQSGIDPVKRNGMVSVSTISVALRARPWEHGQYPPLVMTRHEIVDVIGADGSELYKNGVRTGEGYGYQAGILMPIQYDGDKVDTPKVLACVTGAEGVAIYWSRAKNADQYAVYVKSKDGWKRIAEAPGNFYYDTSAEAEGTYTYTVRGLNADGTAFTTDFDRGGYTYQKNNSYGDTDTAEAMTKAPQITSFTDTADGILIKWNNPYGGNCRLYYKGANDWVRLAETAGTSFLDKDVKWGSSYTYTVRAVSPGGTHLSAYNRDGWKHTHYLKTPEITGFSSKNGGVNITWGKVDGAEKYRVYYKGRNGWTRMAETEGTSYLDTDVSVGTTYTYTVRCVNASGTDFTTDFNSNGWRYSYYPLNIPQITSFESVASGVKINWDKIDGAEKYRVYYYGRNGWTKMGETTSTSFIDADVKVGSTYRYTVRCINSELTKFTSDCNSTGWTYTYSPALDTPHITSYDNLADSIKISWGAVDGAARYRVYLKSADFGSGWMRIGDTSATSINFRLSDYVKDTDLPYVYTVRCITADGKGFCSDFDRDNEPHTFYYPPNITTANSRDGVKISWSWEDGATYRVYYKGRNGWTRMADVKGGEYYDSDVVAGGTYTYTVRRISDDGTRFLSYYNTSGVRHTYDVSYFIPELAQVFVHEGEMYFYSGAPIAGVEKYRLFVRENGSWERFANVDIDYDTHLDLENADEIYKTKDFTPGKTYTFTLRGMDSRGNYVTDFYHEGFTIAAMELAYLSDVSYNPDTKKLTVSWEPVEGAKGYMIHFIPDPHQEIHEPMYIEDATSSTVDTVVYADEPWTVYFGAYNDDGNLGTVLRYSFTPSDYTE